MDELSDYRRMRYKPENVNLKHRAAFNLHDKLALTITGAVGTMYAVYFFATVMLGWILWQTYILEKPFDPYPFAFLLFLGNIIQLLLMPLIMVGQNLQGRHAEIRAEEEFKTTQSSYNDIETVLLHLDKQTQILSQLSKKIDKNNH